MTTHVHISDRLLDFWHVAGDAVVALRTGFMVRVRLNGCGMRPVWRFRTVAFQADHIRGFDEQSGVLRSMHIVAARTLARSGA